MAHTASGNPAGILATVRWVDCIVVVPGSLPANFCGHGEIASSILVCAAPNRGSDRVGWLRVDPSLFRYGLRGLHARAQPSTLAMDAAGGFLLWQLRRELFGHVHGRSHLPMDLVGDLQTVGRD